MYVVENVEENLSNRRAENMYSSTTSENMIENNGIYRQFQQ